MGETFQRADEPVRRMDQPRLRRSEPAVLPPWAGTQDDGPATAFGSRHDAVRASGRPPAGFTIGCFMGRGRSHAHAGVSGKPAGGTAVDRPPPPGDNNNEPSVRP